MTAGAVLDTARLERRRRLSFRAAAIALFVAIVAFPIGRAISGTDNSTDNTDTIAGMFFFAAIIGIIACPWIVRAWQSFMRRQMVAAAVAGRPDIQHIDGEHQSAASTAALSSAAFSLGAFLDSGLVERFESAGVDHILTGDANGVPFGIAEINLLDAKGYRMFGGVLASFRLARPRPGLTIVTGDRGLLGNLVMHAGSSIERLPLEDPAFEGVFEVYGTDQVGGRVILTTTMLERLKALDQLAHAHGFACAFQGEHLLIALSGMSWRCPFWRIVTPVDRWLQEYAAWLAGLVDLPVEIVRTLNLDVRPRESAPMLVAGAAPAALSSDARVEPAQSAIANDQRQAASYQSVLIGSGSDQIFSSALWGIVGEGGMAMTYVASGAVFGGLALVGAWYGFKTGYSSQLFWYFWGMVGAGIVYGAYAISLGLRDLGRLAWKWNAPLRTLKRP